MCSRRRWRKILSLVVVLVTPSMLSPVAAAASGSLPLQNFLPREGFVATKAERSMTILDGSSAVHVVITEKTQVGGQRSSYAKIAINDVVRVEGSMTSDGHLLANRIEVILAADSMRMGNQAKTGTANFVISVIKNGGIVVPMQ